MKEILVVLAVFLFLSINISALCEEGQININSASAEELDKIVYIGPARAEQIIALRPFNSVNDLVRVSGIGEVYLNAIKEQDLACVDDVEDEEEKDEKKEIEEEKENFLENISDEPEISETRIEEQETIILNPQVIKSGDNNEETSKNYALYGFVAFCILIAVLFITKKRKYKNEFR